MAKKKKTGRTVRKATGRTKRSATRTSRRAPKAQRTSARSRRPAPRSALLAPVNGAERKDIGGVRLEVGRAGAARVKRMVYPPGFRWSVHMKRAVGTEFCMHAHVGFLAHGRIHIEYADGCTVEHDAPQIVAIEPGHDGWVVGKEPAVLIEFDFERDTVERLGMPDSHRH